MASTLENAPQKPNFFKKINKLFSFSRKKFDPEREKEAEKGLEKLGAERLFSSSHSIVTEAAEEEEIIEKGWKKYVKINLTIFAIIAAFVIAFLLRLRPQGYTKREIMYMEFIGTIYLRILQGLAVPLLVVSVLSSLSKLNLRLAGAIGLRALIYFVSTSSIAICIGLALTFLIVPGRNFKTDDETSSQLVRDTTIVDAVLDLIRNALPSNLIQTMFAVDRTDLIKPTQTFRNVSKGNETILVAIPLPPKEKWDFDVDPSVKGTNFLGLIFTSIIISLFIGLQRSEKTSIIIDLVDNLNDILTLVLRTALWLTPPGVFFLVVGRIVEMEDWRIFFGQVGLYSLTVIVGHLIHMLIVLPIIYTIFVRKLPFKYFYNMMEAMLTAFATSSSLATLPVTLDCVERKNKIPVIIARFVVTLGATVNMDGTALYQAVSPLFIAQVRKMQVPLLELILMSFTALMASVGAAGIPQGALVIMVIVFDIIGLNAEDMSYIIMVDWLLDRFQTMLNITSDSIGAAVVAKLSQKKLEEFEEKMKNEQFGMANLHPSPD